MSHSYYKVPKNKTPYKMDNPIIMIEEKMELSPFNPYEVEGNNPITHKAFDKMFQSFVYGYENILNQEITTIDWGSYLNGMCEYQYEISDDPDEESYPNKQKMDAIRPLLESMCKRFDQLNDDLAAWEYRNV